MDHLSGRAACKGNGAFEVLEVGREGTRGQLDRGQVYVYNKRNKK